MNSNQGKALLATATIVAIMASFPPVHIILSSGRSLSRGYFWIFLDHSNRWTIDIAQLLTQIILVISIGVVLFILLKNRGN